MSTAGCCPPGLSPELGLHFDQYRLEKIIDTDPLSAAELIELDGYLKADGPHAMSLEAIDGFFAAVSSGPDLVPFSEFLPIILGENFAFGSETHANTMLGMLMRHWNTVVTGLTGTLEKQALYPPYLITGEDGITRANDWASGYLRGVNTRPDDWRGLLANHEMGGPLLPIMLLGHEHDKDLVKREAPIAADQREDLLRSMIEAVGVIYRHFEPARQARSAPQVPIRRTGPKVGRNDPCPCGSGKKFKACHGSAAAREDPS